MSRLYFSTVNLVVLFFACISYAGESNPYVISYPFKSAVIHYTIKNTYVHGKTYEGTEVNYIEGDKLARVIKIAVPDPKGGTTKNTETLQISDPDHVYVIDLVKKTGIKIDNPRKYTKPAYANLSDKEKKAFHERIDKRGIVSLDLPGLGKKVGEEIILGKKCDVYEAGEKINLEELSPDEMDKVYKKNWVWRGANIRLKAIMEGVGWSSELIPTKKVEENVKIPDSWFKVPSDVKTTYEKEKSEFAKQQALATFHLLKTGESIPIKVKLKKRIIRPGEVAKGSEQKIQHAEVSSGVQEVRITVKGGYDPGVIVVKKGIPVRLSFYRDETDGCSEKVVFGDFGISKKLPAYRETSVEFVPDKSGEFTFTCGMSMLEGKLVVKE